MLYVVLPIHWEELGLDALWQVGVLLAANRMIRIPIHPLVGWFYERYRYKSGITIAVILTGVTTISYGMFHSFWLLLLMRCLWGIAWALLKQAGQLAIVDALKDDSDASGRLTGSYNGIVGIGGLAGMVGGGILVQHVSIEVVAWVFGLCAFGSLMVIKGIDSNIPDGYYTRRTILGKTNGMIPSGFTVLLLMSFILSCVFLGILKSSISYWMDQLDIDNAMIISFVGVAGIAGLIQAVRMIAEPFLAPWVGKYSDRSGNRRTLLMLSLLMSILLFGLFIVPTSIGIWITALLGLQIVSIFVATLLDAEAAEQASRSDKHLIVSRYLMSSDIGAAVGPLIGFIIASFMPDTYLIVCTTILLVCALGFTLKRKSPKKGNETTVTDITNVKVNKSKGEYQ